MIRETANHDSGLGYIDQWGQTVGKDVQVARTLSLSLSLSLSQLTIAGKQILSHLNKHGDGDEEVKCVFIISYSRIGGRGCSFRFF